MLVWVSPPDAEVECPGAAPECPVPVVEVAFRWPGAVLECLWLLEVELEWPGAAPECPGLVDVFGVWPGAAPECPGLVDAFGVWPGAAPECPGLVAVGVAEAFDCAEAVLAGVEPAPAAIEFGVRLPAVLGTAVRVAPEDFVDRGAEPASRFSARGAGDTESTRVPR
jgi:hypothetical protein